MRRTLPALLVAGLATLGCEADRGVETSENVAVPAADTATVPGTTGTAATPPDVGPRAQHTDMPDQSGAAP